MALIADTHVHMYPQFDVLGLLRSAWINLSSVSSEDSTKALLLAERSGCNYYELLKSGKLKVSDPSVIVNVVDGGAALLVELTQERSIYVFPGRQINTHEKLEVLALTADLPISDGLPLSEVVASIAAEGAVPVLPWAPGKWTGRRGSIVRSFLADSDMPPLLIGDTSLRPVGLDEPFLFSLARKRGLKLVCGTDPLPLRREERRSGRYATLWPAPFEERTPLLSMRTALATQGRCAGRRLRLGPIALRLVRNELVRRLGLHL